MSALLAKKVEGQCEKSKEQRRRNQQSFIYRLARIVPSDNRPDHETTGPCVSTPELQAQSHHRDLRCRLCAFLNAPALFSMSPCSAGERTYGRGSRGLACL